ncbi:unnamed protein product [Prunus armeniaca]
MMLTVYAVGAITCLDSNIQLHEALPCKTTHVNFLNKISICLSSTGAPCNSVLSASCFSWRNRVQLNSPKKWLVSVCASFSLFSKIFYFLLGFIGVFDVFYYDPLQCRMHDSSSSDDEYRSSRNIAISLFRRYRNVVDRGGGANLKEFISAGVNAYALGCTDEGLRKELVDMKESGVEIEGMQSYGGTTSLKSKIASEEVEECILWLSIIFITILCTPQPTIVRWSSTPPVSDEERLKWKGFCALIANAYYVRGMAWLPVKTLQLEQMAVVGYAEEPSVVASRMRLVFSTLEVVSPQWPRV